MMETELKDPLGKAILAYHRKPSKRMNVTVHSDMMEDDVIPVYYLFREYKDFPIVEKKAVDLAKGKILDVGAGAGAHTKYLLSKGADVSAIDVSEGAVEYLQSQDLPAKQMDFFAISNEQYDTILMLMNGLGIGGNLSNLHTILSKAYELLSPGGCLLTDSTDVRYLYEETDGSIWMNLTSAYYGDFKFQMEFEGEKGEWFDWLYVDFETLKNIASSIGFDVELIIEEENQYLVKLKK